MKKLSLVVLLGLAISAVFTGCNKADNGAPAPSTNAPAAPSTNAP